MITKQERDLILDMLASGKINLSEARDLFDAIEGSAQAEMNPDAQPIYASINDWADSLVGEIHGEIQNTFQRVVDAVKAPFPYFN